MRIICELECAVGRFWLHMTLTAAYRGSISPSEAFLHTWAVVTSMAAAKVGLRIGRTAVQLCDAPCPLLVTLQRSPAALFVSQ